MKTTSTVLAMAAQFEESALPASRGSDKKSFFDMREVLEVKASVSIMLTIAEAKFGDVTNAANKRSFSDITEKCKGDLGKYYRLYFDNGYSNDEYFDDEYF